MPKVKEFYHFKKKMERSETLILGTLGILAHFRHF
jgi:hypothetical protein